MNVTLHIPKSDWYVEELDLLGYKISDINMQEGDHVLIGLFSSFQ